MLPDPYPVKPWQAPCRGSVRLPGSKSLTNRALILASLCSGPVRLEGALASRDSRLLIQNLRALGFEIAADEANARVDIAGLGGRIPSSFAELFVGNAGTAARFLTALVCLHPHGRYRLDGDEEMRRRPMAGLLDCLKRLGARVSFEQNEGCFPFVLDTSGLPGGDWTLDASASSQMLSALMMVAPFASGPVRLHAPGVRPAFVSMTARFMGQFGIHPGGNVHEGFTISPAQSYSLPGPSFRIEPDVSAASYFMILPLVVGGSLLVEGVHDRLLQGDLAFAGVLRDLGMRISKHAGGWLFEAPESLPDRALSWSFETFSDTFLTLAAAAPLLRHPVSITGIGHTRFQETDRIHAMAEGLGRVGAAVSTTDDSITIRPRLAPPGKDAHSVVINTYKDHRVAMSFAILGCRDVDGTGRPWLRVEDPDCCSKTFPGFFRKLEELYRISHDA